MDGKITILKYPRDEVKALAQAGIMNIKSVVHWDVCKELSTGKTIERVSSDLHIPFSTVRKIKECKCP